MECVIETKAKTVRDFLKGISGTIHITFEQGTQSAWLYDLVKPLVAEAIVCNPQHNKLVSGSGNKSDRIDANKLAILLRQRGLKPVYQGESSIRALKEYVAIYEALVADSVRVMNRLKGLFRSRAIRCCGTGIYQQSQRSKWLNTLNDQPLKDRAEAHYELLDWLKAHRKIARAKMLSEARKHKANFLLQTIPGLGAISAAQIIATASTPFRFRTKRQFWAYCGLAVVTRSTSDYELSAGRFVRKRRAASNRGLNRNYSRRLKNVFKAAAMQSMRREPFATFYQTLMNRKMKPELARLTLARKIAATVIAIWKRQESFDKNHLLIKH